MKKYLILWTVFAVFSQSSAQSWKPNFIQRLPKSSYTADADFLAQNHHLIAIAPPSVSIETLDEIDIRALIFQQESASRDFQKEMYSWMLKRKMEGGMTIEIQDIDSTNAELRRAGYYNDTVWSVDKICRTLSVDAVITSNYTLFKPIPVGSALAGGVLEMAYYSLLRPIPEGSTLAGGVLKIAIRSNIPIYSRNWASVTVLIGLQDFKTKKMIWNFNDYLHVSGFTSTVHIVNSIMKEASITMPYTIKQKKL